MKISYTLQLNDFFILSLIGIFVGIVYEFLNILPRIKKRVSLQIIADIIFTLLAFFIFIVSVNIINLGQLRAFLITAYTLGFTLERITIGKIFAKAYKKLYTYLIKVAKVFAKSKLGRILLK